MSSYKRIQPLSVASEYIAGQTVDFMLTFEGEAIIPGSLYLEFELLADEAGTALTGTTDVRFDPFAGAHALIREVTTTSRNAGVLENLNSYSRCVKHRRVATNNVEELGTVSSNSIELCLPSDKLTQPLLAGDGFEGKLPVCLYLQNCLNFASGPINYNKLGETRIRLTLAPNAEFFHGTAVTANTAYKLKNLRLNYRTMPSVEDGPVVMQVMTANRDVISTSQQAIETLVPIVCDAVSCSVIEVAKEQSLTQNTLLMQAPPSRPLPGFGGNDTYYGFNRVQYAVNSSETELQAYPLESREEVILNGLRVYQRGTGSHCCTQDRWSYDEQNNNSDCYLFGTPFTQAMDFRSSKFATELHSSIDAAPYAVYQFFRGAITL